MELKSTNQSTNQRNLRYEHFGGVFDLYLSYSPYMQSITFEASSAHYRSMQQLHTEALEQHDDEMQQDCHHELTHLQTTLSEAGTTMIQAIETTYTKYASDAIVEVHADTGGHDASLFAAELVQAYRNCETDGGHDVEV